MWVKVKDLVKSFGRITSRYAASARALSGAEREWLSSRKIGVHSDKVTSAAEDYSSWRTRSVHFERSAWDVVERRRAAPVG